VPIGLELTRASRSVSRAFEEQLNAAGGTLAVWLILISIKANTPKNQRQIADSVGIRQATLTYHLNSMVEQGLLTRERDQSNRRDHQIKLTDAGEQKFKALRDAALDFDRRLRNGISDEDVSSLRRLLGLVVGNVSNGVVAEGGLFAEGGSVPEGSVDPKPQAKPEGKDG
jgi:MarR family transcriptional regulator, transcriptional regulator for hemolysin